jgi:phage FluMu protein Com
MTETVVCKDCEKVIGSYNGEGKVIGMCSRCYEAL